MFVFFSKELRGSHTSHQITESSRGRHQRLRKKVNEHVLPIPCAPCMEYLSTFRYIMFGVNVFKDSYMEHLGMKDDKGIWRRSFSSRSIALSTYQSVFVSYSRSNHWKSFVNHFGWRHHYELLDGLHWILDCFEKGMIGCNIFIDQPENLPIFSLDVIVPLVAILPLVIWHGYWTWP